MTIRRIASTASRGNAPAAVSAESITASVPSSIGVGDVVRFGARRPRVLDHRLEHLRRRDHGPAVAVREPDDPLLRERHLLERQLDAEIAARDHHGIARLQNSLQCRCSALSFSIFATTSIPGGRIALSARMSSARRTKLSAM